MNSRLSCARFFSLMLLACLLAASPVVHAQDPVRRFALVVGANHGGQQRVKLQYAVSDAKATSRVLQKIGGILPEDCVFLANPTRAAFWDAMSSLRQKITAAKTTTKKLEMIFYYSGHSDDEAILLGGDKVSYKEIHQAIEKTPADVRIAILDSCSSGAFTRMKGGAMRPPFMLDASYDMQGYAFLTSSSSNEGSQESDRLRSSFFTYYLLSGLRGAADMNQDGRVTLSEAYQYAYRETLAKTEKTLGGPQHPNYDIQMSGTGDVVLTDIRTSSAIIILTDRLQGRLFLRNADDNLVLELHKQTGRPIQIGVEEGAYTVTLEKNQQLLEAKIVLAVGQQLELNENIFRPLAREQTQSRGSASAPAEDFSEAGYQLVPLEFMWFPDRETHAKVIHRFALGALGTADAKLDGIAFSLGPNLSLENARGFQFSCLANQVGREMQGTQVAGLYNGCGQDFHGAQLSGIFNLCQGDFFGVQYSGVFNQTQESVSGLQISGVFNRAEGAILGIQSSGVFDIAGGDVSGLQNSGVFSVARGSISGVQNSGVFNWASQVKGLQLAGVFNQSQGEMKGIQAAMVNSAQVSEGVQLGVVNISQTQNGMPLGLVNLSKNGGIDVLAWHDPVSDFSVGVRFRSNCFYSLLAASHDFLSPGWNQNSGAAFYYGIRVPLAFFHFNADLGYTLVDHEPLLEYTADDVQSGQVRVILEYSAGHFLVFAGSGLAYVYQGYLINQKTEDGKEHPRFELTSSQLEPFLLAGVGFSF